MLLVFVKQCFIVCRALVAFCRHTKQYQSSSASRHLIICLYALPASEVQVQTKALKAGISLTGNPIMTMLTSEEAEGVSIVDNGLDCIVHLQQ